MSLALIMLLFFTYTLDAILVARGELGSAPVSSIGEDDGPTLGRAPSSRHQAKALPLRLYKATKRAWSSLSRWITDRLETWVAPKDDKQIAWTLGIGWACCGGGLAGGCLVFAKAM